MANKTTRELDIKRQKEQRYALMTKRLNIFGFLGGIILALSLVFFLTSFAQIFNTDLVGSKDCPDGIEIKMTGFNCFLATLLNGFESVENKFGAVANFNYWVKDSTRLLCYMSTFSLFLIGIGVILDVIGALTKKYDLYFVATVIKALTFITLLIGLISVWVLTGPMLEGYCNNNPKCSIQSFIYFPLILVGLSLVLSVVSSLKYIEAKKLRK